MLYDYSPTRKFAPGCGPRTIRSSCLNFDLNRIYCLSNNFTNKKAFRERRPPWPRLYHYPSVLDLESLYEGLILQWIDKRVVENCTQCHVFSQCKKKIFIISYRRCMRSSPAVKVDHVVDSWFVDNTEISQTRSTQRAQTSLAETDHYSHIARCKNVEPWLWKTTHPP